MNIPKVNPNQVKKIVIFSQQSDGTLRPSSAVVTAVTSKSPICLFSEVRKVQLFTKNPDGSLSPAPGI